MPLDNDISDTYLRELHLREIPSESELEILLEAKARKLGLDQLEENLCLYRIDRCNYLIYLLEQNQ